MKQILKVRHALIDSHWHQYVTITIDGETIDAVEVDACQGDPDVHDVSLIPGYVDTHINGGGGVLLNTTPTVEGVSIIAKAHARYGTTSMLPTLITDTAEIMSRASDAVAEAIENKQRGIIGIHFEGPHLSTEKKGVHKESYIRHVSDAELTEFTRKDLGKVLVTVAPETVPPDIIRELVSQGVTVSLGHSNAPADLVQQALDAGATGFTHLFNAMSQISGREPGMVGQALISDAFCGAIVDHHHIHPDLVRLAIRNVGVDRMMLVTDAMAHVGSDEQVLPFFDTEITRSHNKLTVPGGRLAGSCLDMHSAVLNVHRDLGYQLSEASYMASTTPAYFLGLESTIGAIRPRLQADFVMLSADNSISGVWQRGEAQKLHQQ